MSGGRGEGEGTSRWSNGIEKEEEEKRLKCVNTGENFGATVGGSNGGSTVMETISISGVKSQHPSELLFISA